MYRAGRRMARVRVAGNGRGTTGIGTVAGGDPTQGVW